MWNPSTCQVVQEITYDNPVYALNVSLDEEFVWAAGRDAFSICSTNTWRSVRFCDCKGMVRSLLVVENTVWSAWDDGIIRVHDCESGELVQSLHGHTKYLLTLLKLQGTHVWSAGADETIRVWDAQTYSCIGELRGHRGVINDLQFLQASDMIVSCCSDMTMRLWDRTTQQCRRVIQAHTSPIFAMCSIGNLLWTAGVDTLRTWRLRSTVCCSCVGKYSLLVGSCSVSTADPSNGRR